MGFSGTANYHEVTSLPDPTPSYFQLLRHHDPVSTAAAAVRNNRTCHDGSRKGLVTSPLQPAGIIQGVNLALLSRLPPNENKIPHFSFCIIARSRVYRFSSYAVAIVFAENNFQYVTRYQITRFFN